MLLDNDNKILEQSKFFAEYGIKLRNEAEIRIRKYFDETSELLNSAYTNSDNYVSIMYCWKTCNLTRVYTHIFILDFYENTEKGIERSKNEFVNRVYEHYLKFKPDYIKF